MEFDHLKPATTEDQMEMMVLNIDNNKKPPDFYHNVFVSSSHDDFMTPNIVTDITSTPHFIDHNPPPSSFMSSLPNTTISFSCSSTANSNSSNIVQANSPLTNPIRWRGGGGGEEYLLDKKNSNSTSMAAMREMIFRIAAMQPIHIDPESVKPPRRRNVKISKDPQSVAARHRRERISERIRILQRLVPGGTKMDTASMLDEAIHYVKFLKNQVQSLERSASNIRPITPAAGIGFPVPMSNGTTYVSSTPPLGDNNKSYHHHHPPPLPPDHPYHHHHHHQGLQYYGAT